MNRNTGAIFTEDPMARKTVPKESWDLGARKEIEGRAGIMEGEETIFS